MTGPTGLTGLLRARITESGPITVAEFMEAALSHPEFGAYRRADPLGAGGHFITAPEISQMFGELIGAWCVAVWRMMGAPSEIIVAELGPGRGTLMADLLRVAAIDFEFRRAASIHLVETSPVLKAAQAKALGHVNLVWHDAVEDLPNGPLLLIANEFFDALPIRQFVYRNGQWRERRVDCSEAGFRFVDGMPADIKAPEAKEGDIFESSGSAQSIAAHIGQRIAKQGGAALIIDYGHRAGSAGETLQAVRRHGFAELLADPGGADISAHVDFDALARAAAPARAWGPIEQRVFLRALGIELRAASLMRANPARADEFEQACRRLIAPLEMGTLFKVMALAHPSLPAPPGIG